MCLEFGRQAHFEWEVLFALSCFSLVLCTLSSPPPPCSPLCVQWLLPPPASLHLHSGIMSTASIWMLLPHRDIGSIAKPVPWPPAWLGSWFQGCLFVLRPPWAMGWQQFIFSLLSWAPDFQNHAWLLSSTLFGASLAHVTLQETKILAFKPVALELLSAFCFYSISDRGKGLFVSEPGITCLVFSFYILIIIAICVA